MSGYESWSKKKYSRINKPTGEEGKKYEALVKKLEKANRKAAKKTAKAERVAKAKAKKGGRRTRRRR